MSCHVYCFFFFFNFAHASEQHANLEFYKIYAHKTGLEQGFFFLQAPKMVW